MTEKVTTSRLSAVSDTSVSGTEPEWFRNGDAWVKLFLKPDGSERAGDVAPGKFKQHDYVHNVPGENEFPFGTWFLKERRGGFDITHRRDVWSHLSVHSYKSAYIAEVVSMGEEFYDIPDARKRKVRVVTFGPAVPLADVLGKHPDDFKDGEMLVWSARNNHFELCKLAVSMNSGKIPFRNEFAKVFERGYDHKIAELLFANSKSDEDRQKIVHLSICNDRTYFVRKVLDSTPVDKSFYQAACSRGNDEIFHLLRKKYGEPRCGDIIVNAIMGGSPGILNYIKSRGVDMSDFGMFVFACAHYASLQTVKYLISKGADAKHPLIAYIAKTRARVDTRRYLLNHHIEDKSNVPVCKELENQIRENCNSFFKRFDADELDVE
jgi:hypothetical protein